MAGVRSAKSFKSFIGNITPFSALIFVIFSVSLSWFADGFSELISDKYKAELMIYLSMAFLFVIFTVVYFNLKEYGDEVVDLADYKCEPKKVLVLFLSSYKPQDKIEEFQFPDIFKKTKIINEHEAFLLGNWLMPFVAINYHFSEHCELRDCFVIPSTTSSKSKNDFKELFSKYFKKSNCGVSMPNIEFIDEIDFNDMFEVTKVFRKLFVRLKEMGYRERDIVVDITSGTKLCSASASFFALANNRLIQYVDTNDYTIKMFNNRVVSD